MIPNSPQTTQDRNKRLIKDYLHEINKGNDSILKQVFAPECTFHLPEPVEGLNSYLEINRHYLNTFPDLHIIINDLLADNDKVVARLTLQGSHQGNFIGIPPTGRKVSFTAIIIYQIVGGKITEFWSQEDLLGLTQQFKM